jgi:hypothetical protein
MDTEHKMTREEKIQLSKKLQNQYLHERANGQKQESLVTEREYLVLRKELIDEVTTEVVSKKSLHISEIKDRVAKREKRPKRETGIPSLDRELVNQKDRSLGKIGGFPLGNFIQFAGVRESGKSTMLLKILAGISNYEMISWFDFEMGDEKAVDMLGQFEHQNVEYYDGSRELSDIVDEIKYLYASGVRHFMIDSAMKINAKGYDRGYQSFSYISSVLSELTSTLGINIYLINQMSSDSQRNNTLMLKHGNDAEYDADYIFFVLKKPTDMQDEAGQIIYDENCRVIVCNKNRVDKRGFTVEIPISEIFGIQPEIIEYEG